MPLRDNWSGATQYTHLGITFAGAVLLCFFGGYWVDGKIGTQPWLSIVGAFAGATGGFINLVRTLTRMQRESEEQEKRAMEGDE